LKQVQLLPQQNMNQCLKSKSNTKNLLYSYAYVDFSSEDGKPGFPFSSFSATKIEVPST